MKKAIFFAVFVISALSVHAQRLATVGILPFEAGAGANANDAAEATRLVIAELSSWDLMTVLSGGNAQSGEYVVKGQISRQNNMIILTAVTSSSSGRALNNSRQETQQLNAGSIESFCAQIAENVPLPNYLLGKWRCTINMIDGPVTCIMEFRTDRSVNVQKFDTWEHTGVYSLKYQGIGDGTYTYAPYRRRTVNVGGRSVQADATVGLTLSLEDALPKYESINMSGMRVLFDGSWTSFEFVTGGIPCGENRGGSSVYASENVFFTRFSKIN
jgi:hypothetical protein